MKRYLLDTNIIIRFLMADPPRSARIATDLFADAAAGRCLLVLTDVVLAESVYVLRSFYKVPAGRVADLLFQLIRSPGIETDDPKTAQDALARMGASGIDYADCHLAARAAGSDITISTLDRDFRKFDDIRTWPD
jgi:predicted nucleic acid-binding protein